MSKGGRFAKQPVKNTETQKAGAVAKVLVALGVVLVLALAGAVGMTVYDYSLERMMATAPTVPTLAAGDIPVTEAQETVPAVETEAVVETTEPPYTPSGKDIINVMLVGQSYREDEQSYLSDSNILITINKKTKTMTMTSFLRDTYVDLPNFKSETIYKECGYNRINTAYALGYSWGGQAGAMKMMNDTVKLNFGVDVDYNVEVDFDGFLNAISVLGMIPMELTESEAKYLNKDLNKALGYDAYYYQAVYEDGSTVSMLDPMSCLSYARMRHSDGGDNDFKRSERQRKLIVAIIDQIRSRSLKTLMNFATTMLQQISTNMTDDEILTCMWEVLPLLPELKIESNLVPTEGSSKPKTLMIGEVKTTAMDITWNNKNRDMIMAYAEADTLAAQPAG